MFDRRPACYVGIAIAALAYTVLRDSGDVTRERRVFEHSDDDDIPDVAVLRRPEWHLLTTARTLIDITADYAAMTSSSEPESRAAAIENGAKRLLAAAGSDDAAIAGLKRLAGVLKHYRDHVILKPTDHSDTDKPEVLSKEKASLVQNIAEALKQADAGRKNQVSKMDRETLSLHEDDGNLTSWQRFQNGITARRLYDVNDTVVDDLVADLTHLAVSALVRPADFWLGHLSQNKLIFEFVDLGRAMFRPCRGTLNDDDVPPDVVYFMQQDRAHAELAAFHIDRILGFGRAPPVAWSAINLTRDVETSPDADYIEFTVSPLGNKCYSYECTHNGHTNPVCADGHMLNGSFATFLPTEDKAKAEAMYDPWRHERSVHEPIARWQRPEEQDSYCDEMRKSPPLNIKTKLLDVVDIHIFDFLIGNMDRRHLYSYRTAFGDKAAFIHLNSAKGFGKARTDDVSILAPLYQCCEVRHSTVRTLLELANSPRGQKLSDRLKRSMAAWPMNPSLRQEHLDALDRRVWIVLEHVDACQKRAQEDGKLGEGKGKRRDASTIIDDGF